MSAIVAISQEYGLIAYHVVEGAVNREIFSTFLDQLFQAIGSHSNVYLFMDNLRVHHTLVVRDKLKRLGWTAIFNAAYSSEIHCIETYFAAVKVLYRKQTIKEFGRVSRERHLSMISEAIEGVPKEQVIKIVKKYRKIWEDMADMKSTYWKRPKEARIDQWEPEERKKEED